MGSETLGATVQVDNVTNPAQNVSSVVPWPMAQRYLRERTASEYRLAAKGVTEFERGRRAGRGEMCEELMNLPETLALLAEEDEKERKP